MRNLRNSSSDFVNRSLKDKGYQMVERGEIEIKGKGKMLTFFLEKNLLATESEIMGISTKSADCASDPPYYSSALQGLLIYCYHKF